jgi:hypothetical protein
MSIAVALGGLRAALDERPAAAYLLTVSDDGRPHAVPVRTAWDGDRLVADVGTTTARNADRDPMHSPAPYCFAAHGRDVALRGSTVVPSAHITQHPTTG